MDVIPRATYYNQGTWTHFVCSGCMPQLCLLCKVSYFPEFISKFNSLNIIKACLPALLSGNNYLGYPQNIGVEGSKIIQILILQRRGRPGLFEVGFCTALGWSLRMLGEGCPAVFQVLINTFTALIQYFRRNQPVLVQLSSNLGLCRILILLL